MKLHFMICVATRIVVFIFIILAFASITQPVLSSSESLGICQDYISPAADDIKKPDPGNIPFGAGLLWKIVSPDGTFAHIYGTMHSQDRLVTSIPPSARLALVKSKEFVMEVLLDQHANEIFNENIYFSDDRDLRKLIDGEIFSWLTKNINDYGIHEENLWRLKPWAAFTMVGRPKPVRGPSQDIALMQIAASANVKITGLETMADLVKTLDGIPMADQVTILNDTVCNHKEILRQTRDIINMYVNGNLAGIIQLINQPHYDEAIFERYIQRILYDRNNRILGQVERIIHQNNAFIAIGASHLPDKRGLLYMLEKRGYKITRVY